MKKCLDTIEDVYFNLVDMINDVTYIQSNIQSINLSDNRSYVNLMRWLNECENNLLRAKDYCDLIDREVKK